MSDKLRGIVHFNERNNVEVEINPVRRIGMYHPYKTLNTLSKITSYGSQSGLTITNIDDIYTKIEGTTTGAYKIYTDNLTTISGHKYFYYMPGSEKFPKNVRGGNAFSSVIEGSKTNGITEASGNSAFLANDLPVGTSINTIISYVIIDLTDVFGNGNEPVSINDDRIFSIINVVNKMYADGEKLTANGLPSINIKLTDYIYEEEFTYSGDLPGIGEV